MPLRDSVHGKTALLEDSRDVRLRDIVGESAVPEHDRGPAKHLEVYLALGKRFRVEGSAVRWSMPIPVPAK